MIDSATASRRAAGQHRFLVVDEIDPRSSVLLNREWWRRHPARALVVLQVVAIFVLGSITVARFHIFAEIDERAHLAYVQEIAEHGRIPWLGRDYVSWQELAIEQHTYPRPSGLDPRLLGLRGSSYEGWQPPLYYVLAAPAYLIPGNYRDKILAVRAFDLLLLMAAVALLVLLTRSVFKEHWQTPSCLALSTLLWPGVIVRAITVSNAALELPLVLLYVLVLWSATARPRAASLVAAGGLLALCVLTQITLACLAILLLVPVLALSRERGDRTAVGATVLALALPIVLLAPWLAMNESRYGALTASSLVERLTAPFSPRGSGLGALTSGLARFAHAALPQEWWVEYHGLPGAIALVLPAVLLLSAALPTIRRPLLLRSRPAALLAAPLVLGMVTLAAVALLADWPASIFPRYVNPMLPLFTLFAAWAWASAGMGQRALLRIAALSSVAVCLIWFYMGSAYYFTNVGAKLGIHAAGTS
jgi:4-amino-4-deoxy-L-arabinose transferase-like glycosyltransferase